MGKMKMSNMDRKTALETLKAFQTWRRYDGDIFDINAPSMPHPFTVGEAIDVAIHELEIQCQETPKKEYYGG